MRIFKALIVLLAINWLAVSVVSSQSNSADSFNSNLYFIALRTALQAEYDAYSKQSPDRDHTNAIVEANEFLNEGFPKEIGRFRVEYLSYQELGSRYKVKKEQIPVMIMTPIRNEGAKLIISISDYWVSFPKKNHSVLSLEGGTKVTFIYDLSTNQFVVEDIHLWGV